MSSGLSDILVRSYIPFLANIGVLALLAWVVSIYGRELSRTVRTPHIWFSLVIGVSFGATAALLMNIPIEFEPGIFGDARAVPVLLSGIFGGPVAALVAGAIAGGMRILLGGGGVLSGLIYVAIFAAFSIMTFWAFNRRAGKLPGLVDMLLIATVATGVSSIGILTFNPASRLPILLQLWPLLLAANIFGIALLGGMLGREYARRLAEQESERERRRADSAAEAKSKFLTAMSHDIRTPLNAILGIHQILDRADLPRDVKEKIKTAQDSGQFLLALINQILDFAKIDAGSLPVKPAPFSVQVMLNALQSIFFYQAGAKGIELEVSYDGTENDVIVADRNLVQQILFNLIGNAIKFTRHGSVSVRASLREDAAGTGRLEIDVTDTGPGISEEDQSRIFEEFEQTETGIMSGGTGLGLAICKRIADTIGASLSVKSQRGKGATFSLALDAPQGELTDAPPGPVTAPMMPVAVLVVEDNMINQEIARTMLEQDGHVVEIASNGREAVELLSEEGDLPDIVFMDIQMPEMDGVEATKAIRRIHDAETLPIIALSANAFSDQQAEYIGAGMNGAISKPVQIAELRNCIKRFAGKRYNGDTLPMDAGEDRTTAVPLVDPAVLDPLVSVVNPEMLEDLVRKLRTSASVQLTRLQEVGSDPALVGAISHELKGMLGNFGLARAAKAAEKLAAVRDGDEPVPPATDELFREVEHSFLELERQLKARTGRSFGIAQAVSDIEPPARSHAADGDR
ncbi:ATP-binding protein [Pacificispira sp.]|uniref:ATP-binding protein n=1 Tax=Pacificispira sp. TaxID=2888761 RepID=UPI003BA8C695